MSKRIPAFLLAALMLFVMAACSFSSSSTTTTTITTSKIDSNGITTTNTVTSEVGVSAGTDGISTTNQTTQTTTTTPADDNSESDDDYTGSPSDKFYSGAEGVSDAGEKILFAYDDPEVFSYGAMIIISEDGQNMMAREGEIVFEEDWYKIVDEVSESEIPFYITDTDEDDTFIVTFQDGDCVTMTVVEQETILSDMDAIMIEFGLWSEEEQ